MNSCSAVIEKKPYKQQYPIDSPNPKFEQEIDAGELWDKIIHNAWASAEPGVLFWDTISNEAIPDCYADLGFKTVSTNPCGEIPLCPYDSCRLLALNLYSYVDDPFTENAIFNSDKFTDHAHKALRIMDDIIDLEVEKIEAIIAKIDADPERMRLKVWKETSGTISVRKPSKEEEQESASPPKEICWQHLVHDMDQMLPLIFLQRYINSSP